MVVVACSLLHVLLDCCLIMMDLSIKLELCKKLISISLYLVGFSFMLWAMVKSWASNTAVFRRLIEFRGIISKADVSSKNLIRSRQSDSSLFVITVKRIILSLVPWGIPPLSVCQSDRVPPILTACCRLVKNAAIQLRSAGWTSSLLSSCIKMVWSMRLNPFEKSAKKIRATASPLSTASWIACSM